MCCELLRAMFFFMPLSAPLVSIATLLVSLLQDGLQIPYPFWLGVSLHLIRPGGLDQLTCGGHRSGACVQLFRLLREAPYGRHLVDEPDGIVFILSC